MLNSFSRKAKGFAKWALTLKKLMFAAGNCLMWGGAWQLDLLAAPAFWRPENWLQDWYGTIFYLPFNIAMDKQMAYCMFWVWIFVGAYMMCLPFFLASDEDKARAKAKIKGFGMKVRSLRK